MTHWSDVFLYELRQQFRSKSYRFITFVVPVLAIVAFFAYQTFTGSDEDEPAEPVSEVNKASKALGYADLTGLFPGPDHYDTVDCDPNESDPADTRSDVIKRVTSPYCLRGAITAYETVQAGQDALEDGEIDMFYVVEPDYVETGNLSVYMDEFSFEQIDTGTLMDDYLIRSALVNLDSDEYEALYMRLRDPALVTDHRITETGATAKENENQNYLLVYGFGILLIMSVFWGGGYVMQSVVQEKETRTIEIMLSSVRPMALLAGKVLAMGLLALLQMLMLVGTFIFISTQAGDTFTEIGNVEIEPGRLVIMFIYFVLGFLLFGSIMAAIGALSTSVRESQNFVVVITLPAMIPFFFLSVYAEEPNSTLPVVMSLIPLTAPISMIMRAAVTDVPAGQLLLSLGLLVLGVAFSIWMAGRLFRVNTLLAGSVPRLRDIPYLILRG